MANQHHHNILYTSADILKYHQGKLTPIEMNALEKAALQDPFLSDALDGFVAHEQAASDLIELQQKLSQKQQAKKKAVIFSWKKYYPIIGVAASVTLLLFLGYMLSNQNNNIDSSASNEMEPLPSSTKQQNILPNKADTASPQLAAVEIKKSRQNTESIQLNSTADIAASKTIESRQTNAIPISEVPVPSIEQEKQPTEDLATLNKPQDIRVFSTNEVKDLTAGSATGNMAMTDAKIPVTNIQTNIEEVNQKAGMNNAQVVVTAARSQKKQSITKNIAPTLDNEENSLSQENEAFQNYVTKNMSSCLDNQQQPIHGQIVLTCKINALKKAFQIKITESLSKECDNQVVELLKGYAEWKAPSTKKVKLIVQL